jgi:hypothetical protein|tara:strand:- start:79 stop:360 length:282 start_codon:yes stop_codon:yes gene_type:complete
MRIETIIDVRKIKNLPYEINWNIFSFLSHNNASILIDAFWTDGLNLRHICFPKLSLKIWNELRPSYLESNVYGSGMHIIRTKILIGEKMLLLT